jgi:methylmalonyl-CoA/ethylmalonyl-CoA epimerase
MSTDPSSAPGALFEAIDHVGIAVSDFDAAVTMYADLFGMTVTHEEINEEQGVREAMLSVGAPVGGSVEGSPASIQLLAPLSADSPIARFIDRRGQGIQQLAYRVRDLDAVSATLRERGAELLYDEPKRGTADSRVNFIHPRSAGGVLVELVEPAG